MTEKKLLLKLIKEKNRQITIIKSLSIVNNSSFETRANISFHWQRVQSAAFKPVQQPQEWATKSSSTRGKENIAQPTYKAQLSSASVSLILNRDGCSLAFSAANTLLAHSWPFSFTLSPAYLIISTTSSLPKPSSLPIKTDLTIQTIMAIPASPIIVAKPER